MKLTSKRLSQLGIEVAVMQAGMPGIATAKLAAAVARSGGIGTLGLLDVSLWEREIIKAKSLAAGHPLCVNLLLPYTRRKHVDVLIAHKIPMVSFILGREPRAGFKTTETRHFCVPASRLGERRKNTCQRRYRWHHRPGLGIWRPRQ